MDFSNYKKALEGLFVANRIMVRPEGLEPPTPWSEAKYSIH